VRLSVCVCVCLSGAWSRPGCSCSATTTLRNVLGTKDLSEILSEREYISNSMQVRMLYISAF